MIQFLTRRWLFIVSALVALFVLAGCGGPPPVTSWPGYFVTKDIAYLASASELDAVNFVGNVVAPLRGWPYKSPNAGVGYYTQPALAPDGNTLYVGTEQSNGNQGVVEAFSNVGRDAKENPIVKWSYPLTATDPIPGNIYGAIVLDNNVLYFADGKGQVFALDAETGQQRWQKPFRTEARIWSSPVVDTDTLYIASQDHHLYAIQKDSGNQVWKFPEDNVSIDALVGSPTLADGTVYMGSFGGVLYAVDAANGKLKWSYKANGSLWDGPAVMTGTLYFGDLDGNMYTLDAATGKPGKWTAKLEGGVKAAPLVQDGVVYVGTDQRHMYALDAATGQFVWPQPFTGRDGDNMMVTPVIRGDILLVLPNLAGTDPVRLYGLNKSNGALAWRYPPAQQ